MSLRQTNENTALAAALATINIDPLPIDLDAALGMVDRTFGIDRIMRDEGQDLIATYYEQSRLGYEKLHAIEGCMHVALNRDGQFHNRGFYAQADFVTRHIRDTGATDVLEVGSGMGFNVLHLARRHPQCRIVGMDLLSDHVERSRRKAEGVANARFVQGSYEPMPEELGRFDVIFGVETLCYARDLTRVAASVARALKPGGRFIIYDAHRKGPLGAQPPALATATKLYELTTAVTHGFWQVGDWEAAMQAAGLQPVRTRDMTPFALPGLRVLQNRALRFFTDWKLRMAAKAMPTYLVRNAVAGLVGPFICFGPGPGIDLAKGSISYQRIVGFKPA